MLRVRKGSLILVCIFLHIFLLFPLGTTHSVRSEEQMAFSDWINTNLGHDEDLQHLLPLDHEGKNLYDAVKDGILLSKIVNHSCPDTVDERVINKNPNSVYKR